MSKYDNDFSLLVDKLSLEMQYHLIQRFFSNYYKGLLRVDISEKEILKLSEKERYNFFFICLVKSVSYIPTVEMKDWVNKKFAPDFDICGGAGNLGFCLGIPTSDSHFRLKEDFRERMDTKLKKMGKTMIEVDYTVCKNTMKLTANEVAKMEDVETVIGSWILVKNPNKLEQRVIKKLGVEGNEGKSNLDLNLVMKSLSRKEKEVAKEIDRHGVLGVPNGINLKGLLADANLVFIGNHEVHSNRLIKTIYGSHKHVTYNQKDLPFLIIDKPWLRGVEDKGFIKYFPKKK